MDKCECETPGFCKLFNRQMSPHLYNICQTDERSRNIFYDRWVANKKERKPIDYSTITPREVSTAPSSSGEKLPPISQMIVNFTVSIGRWAARGFKVVDKEEFDRRLAICEQCPHWLRGKQRCAKCGCRSQKLHLATEQCPLDPPKWNRVDK